MNLSRWSYRPVFSAALALLMLQAAFAQEDMQALANAQCEFGALTVKPPEPWYSVPIDSAEPGIGGCQLMWEEGDQYLGIIRLIAFENSVFDGIDVRWEDFAIAFEASIMADMYIELGDVLWRDNELPISGEGFVNARAIALEARISGVERANEAHFVLFEGNGFNYVMSSLTPSEKTSPDVYKANIEAMGLLMRSLQPSQ